MNFTVSPQCNPSNVYVSADSNLIDPSHTVKDLGVLMSNDCMFDDHMSYVRSLRNVSSYVAGYRELLKTEISTVVLPPEAERPLLSDLYVEDCRGIGT